MRDAQMKVWISGTGSYFPNRVVTNEEISRDLGGKFTPEQIEEKSGIVRRSWAKPRETAADMACEALLRALHSSGLGAEKIRRLILTTSMGADHILPSISNLVHHRAGLSGDCFEINNACTSFLTAFDLAARSVVTGIFPVAIVSVEACSYFIDPSEPRCYSIFGDGAAAAILTRAESGGILASQFYNDGSRAGMVKLEHLSCQGPAPVLKFHASNQQMKEGAVQSLADIMMTTIASARLLRADIDWFVPHQPNGRILELLLEKTGIESDRVFGLVRSYGSLGCVSVPASLAKLFEMEKIQRGSRIALAAVGLGVSAGAIVYQHGTQGE